MEVVQRNAIRTRNNWNGQLAWLGKVGQAGFDHAGN